MMSKQVERTIVNSSIVVAEADQISSDLGGEVVILNFKSGVYHGLNEVGATIWSFIQQPRTVKEISDMLMQEYDVDVEQCNSDLAALLSDLLAAELISINNETTA